MIRLALAFAALLALSGCIFPPGGHDRPEFRHDWHRY